MENRTKQEVSIRIKAGWSIFGKYMYREIFQDRYVPMSVKRKVFNQCVLPTIAYGCQTRSLTKALVKKLETSKRAMERKILNVKLKDIESVTPSLGKEPIRNGNGLDTSPK